MLPASFFARPVVVVARQLVGKLLLHRHADVPLGGRIVETEAYRGPDDRAAHSHGGRRTARTEAMYGAAGTIYMFRVYGLHWAFNVVTGARDKPEAVLIRALEPYPFAEDTIPSMAKRRFGNVELPKATVPPTRRYQSISNGPGKLCQACGLDGTHYGTSVVAGPVYICHSAGPKPRVVSTPRINVDYAGPDAERPWRFLDAQSAFVSAPPR